MLATIDAPRPGTQPPNQRFGPGGAVYSILTRGDETGGALFAFVATEPPGGGPPLHVHRAEDEFFVVLEGELTFWVEGQVARVIAGGTAFVPRGRAHCFKNVSARAARVLVVFSPATVERFFDYGLSIDGLVPTDAELLERIGDLAPRFGLDVLGPSPL